MKYKSQNFTEVDAPDDVVDVADSLSVGQLIRDLRRRRGVTVEGLASAINRSVGFVSQIERGVSQPTTLDLNLISQHLGVPGIYFYPIAAPAEWKWLTHPNGRRALRFEGGISDQLVSPSLASRLCVIESMLQPGADTGEQSIIEHLEQAIYVLEGELTIWVNREMTTLRVADACQLSDGVPIRYANRGKIPAKVLWICC